MGIFKNDDQKSSQFGFDEKSMAGKAVKAVRWIYAITGVVAFIAGIALLFAPAKSLVFLTTVLGFYFVITAAIRLFTAIFEPLLPTGWRVTSIISNLLIILGGVIILRNQAFSTATLTTMVVIWLDCRRCHVHSGVRAFVQPRPRHPERRTLHHRRHVRVYLSAVVGQDARHL